MPVVGRARGFTLLELLIVLSVVGLLSALVAPRISTWADAAQQRARLQALRQQLQALPEQAFLSGQGLHWRGAPDQAPPLQALQATPVWQLRAKPGLFIDSNGMTEAASIEVLGADGQVLARWRWISPAGRLESMTDAQAGWGRGLDADAVSLSSTSDVAP